MDRGSVTMPIGDRARALATQMENLATAADALDQAHAAEVADLRRQLEQATRTAARFPGDPGLGRILLGAATRNGNLPRIAEHEKPTGTRLVRRRYWNNGIGDLGAPLRTAIAEDHKAGRIPAVSIKPGPFGTIASGKHDAPLRDFIAWCERQPLPTFFMADHEPENNGIDKTTGRHVRPDDPAKFRADQQRVRSLITDTAGQKPERLSFGGSLMVFTWTPEARGKGVPAPDEWNPGPGVWDWCGADQYAQKAGTPILDKKWAGFKASVKKWGVPLAVTELGIRSADPKAGDLLRGFYEDAVAAGAVMLLYYDNDVNSTGEGWILTGRQLEVFRELLTDPRTARP